MPFCLWPLPPSRAVLLGRCACPSCCTSDLWARETRWGKWPRGCSLPLPGALIRRPLSQGKEGPPRSRCNPPKTTEPSSSLKPTHSPLKTTAGFPALGATERGEGPAITLHTSRPPAAAAGTSPQTLHALKDQPGPILRYQPGLWYKVRTGRTPQRPQNQNQARLL